MHFLLDTNILISAEPTSPEDIESRTPAIVTLLNLFNRGSHVAMIHPASVQEVLGDKNESRVATRELLLGKYPRLQRPPPVSSRLLAELGSPKEGSNSAIDLLLLSVLEANAVDYFVTEDDGIHRRARRVGLGDRVLTAADAIVTLAALFPSVPESPPFVSARLAHELDETDPVFDSFRADYPPFNAWLAKCKREQRQAWVIETGKKYGGVCIVVHQSPNEYGLPGKILKLCSFKIADSYRGYRYGELLLKTLFGYLVKNEFDGVFVEVLPKHQELFDLFADFGFLDVRESSKHERVLFKALKPPAQHAEKLTPLEFNIRYGPFALTLAGANVYVVPIRPQFHRLLFPELEPQLVLRTESHPFGNSIRKAYLSHSHIRKITAGDVLLFYRSQISPAITAIGVAESTLVSSNPSDVAHFVGKRTVYSFEEIVAMAAKPILAVQFRLARGAKPAWELDQLIKEGIIKRAPQSFMQVAEEGVKWVASRLAVPH